MGFAFMSKALSIFGVVIAVILLFAFGLDVAIGVPFSGANTTMDIVFVICALILGYLSWDALRDIK